MTEPDYLDDERTRNWLELKIKSHPEQERVHRFLRCGAGLIARRVEDEVDFALAFTDAAQDLAQLRGETWDGEPEEPTEEELDEVLLIGTVPVDVLRPKPQG